MKRIPNLTPILLTLALSGPALKAQTPATPSTQIIPDSQTTGTLNTAEPEGTTDIRIVRLSQANGKVTMDRNTGLGFEAAFNNLPVTQGAKLKTDEGAAEVEFEDGSTLRLTPNSRVDFPQLSRTPTGATLSTMNVLSGTVYVSLLKTKGNTFTLTSGDGRVVPRPGAHIRLEVKNPETRLAVISGSADFTSTAGPRTVGKMTSLIFNTQTKASPDLIAGIEDSQFDEWDQHQQEFRNNYAKGNALNGSGAVYGLDDLNYYGQFVSLGGCGRVWRPYFVSAGWDPYAAGIWAWYPASGYTWVSPYPWGWAPFHYGSWLQCAGGGWGWQPGGTWTGLRNVRHDHDGDHHHDHDGDHRHHRDPTQHPLPPRPVPAPGRVTSIVAVNAKPVPFSHVDRYNENFVIRNDSAGLGIPRGDLGRLNKLNRDTVAKGSVTLPVHEGAPPNFLLKSPAPENGFARTDSNRGGSATHAGYFNRPGSDNASNSSPNWHRGDESRGSNRTDTADSHSGGYSGGSHNGTAPTANPTNGSPASSHPGSYSGSNNAGYSGGSHNNGGGSYSGGGYSGGSHNAGGNSSSNGGGGYSGGQHSGGGGGYSGGGGGGGGSHSSPASSAPASAPAPSAPAPAASSPAPSAPASHK